MLEHFSNNTVTTPPVEYLLFCHFPSQSGQRSLTEAELDEALSTTNLECKKIVNRITANYDKQAFLSKCTITFGESLKNCEASVVETLIAQNFTREDVESIIFPSALQRILEISTNSDVEKRSLTREPFLQASRDIKQVTFKRWMLELSTKDKILRRLRNDMNQSFSHNSRRRYFIISDRGISDFDDKIVLFLKSYVEKYFVKPLHTFPALFCFNDDIATLEDIKERLYEKGIKCNDGYVSRSDSGFRLKRLLETPLNSTRQRRIERHEFQLLIAKQSQLQSLNGVSPDDIFIVNAQEPPWNTKDINVFHVEVEKLSQLSFLLQTGNTYD